MREITYAEAIREALREELRKDESVFVFGEDVGLFGGCFGVTGDLFQEFPDRVKDTPISEAAIMGLALGSGLMGMHPVAEIMFGDFLTVCFDYLANQAAKVRYMCGGQVQKLPLVVRAPIGGGIRAAGQHSQCVEGWFTQIPGLKVVMPASPRDAKGLLKSAIWDNNPVLFLEHKQLYALRGPVPEGEYTVPIGKAEVKREGSDVTVIATSWMVQKSLAAAQRLSDQGTSVEVIDLRTVLPLDVETIVASARKTHRALLVQEAPKLAGTNAQVGMAIMENAFDSLDAPVRQVAALDTVIPFSPALEDHVLPSEDRIAAAIADLAAA